MECVCVEGCGQWSGCMEGCGHASGRVRSMIDIAHLLKLLP